MREPTIEEHADRDQNLSAGACSSKLASGRGWTRSLSSVPLLEKALLKTDIAGFDNAVASPLALKRAREFGKV